MVLDTAARHRYAEQMIPRSQAIWTHLCKRNGLAPSYAQRSRPIAPNDVLGWRPCDRSGALRDTAGGLETAIASQTASRSAKRPANVPATIRLAPSTAEPVTGSDRKMWARAKPNSGSVPIRKPTLVGLVRRTAAFWT